MYNLYIWVNYNDLTVLRPGNDAEEGTSSPNMWPKLLFMLVNHSNFPR